MTESSSYITSVIRGISKFEGTPAKYQDWKRAVTATLRLTRPETLYELIDGAPCPHRKFREFSSTAVGGTARTPQRSTAGVQEEKQQEEEAPQRDNAGEDQDNGGDDQESNQDEDLQQELRNTARGSPRLDFAASMYCIVVVNEEETKKWKKNNAALFSVLLYLTTVGAAGSILTKFEAKKEGEYSDGQAAWRFMREKYENNSII